jgi:hypothetical protein
MLSVIDEFFEAAARLRQYHPQIVGLKTGLWSCNDTLPGKNVG